MDESKTATEAPEQAEPSDESWPPIFNRPVSIEEYGYVTVHEQQDRMEIRAPSSRRWLLGLIAGVYDVLVLVLPLVILYRYWHTLDPRIIIPHMGRRAGGFEFFIVKCIGGAVIVHLIIFCASRISRARELIVLMPKLDSYVDGLGKRRPLSAIREAAITQTAGVFVVRLAPIKDRPFGGGALAPVWWMSSKEKALALTGRLNAFAGIPVRSTLD